MQLEDQATELGTKPDSESNARENKEPGTSSQAEEEPGAEQGQDRGVVILGSRANLEIVSS